MATTYVSAAAVRNAVIDALTGRGGVTINSGGYAYLALSSTVPSYNASGEITGITEPVGQGYARKLIGHSSEQSTKMFSAASQGATTNADEIHFDQATEGGTGWGAALTHWAIYPAATGGTPLMAGELTDSITVDAGKVVILKKGQVQISLQAKE